ncbi:MAG: ABC transporter substrate-binding protein [Pseudomonadota bacterium]
MKRLLLSTAIALALSTPVAFAQDDGLTVIWAEDRSSAALLDPRITQSRHEIQAIIQMFDTLIAADGDGKLYPGLATEWEIADDFKSIKMTLRDDVTFHDGTPFNAEAVKFTFDTIADPATGSQGAVDYLGPYDRTEVISDTELVVHFSRPYPPIEQALSEVYLAPVSPTAVQNMGNTDFAQAPVGTGPFKFVEWKKGEQIEMERFDDYNWAPEFYDNEGPSQVEKVIYRFIQNAATRVAALEAGEVTMVDLTPPLDLRRLGESDEFETIAGTVSGLPYSMMFNTSQWPLDELAVRQAVIKSVDRAALTENLFWGLSEPAYGVLSSATPSYWAGAEDYYAYDPEGAVKLLTDAGWTKGDDGIWEKDGKDLSIHYLSMLEPDTGVALQAALRDNGIILDVENVTKARQDELIMNNDYGMGAIRWVSNSPAVLSIPFHSSNIPSPGVFKFNWMHVASEELDQMLADATSAASADEQEAQYAEVQKWIMDRALFWAIHDQTQMIAYDADITGVRFAPGRWQVRFYDIRPAD